MVVLRHGQWVRTLSRTMGINTHICPSERPQEGGHINASAAWHPDAGVHTFNLRWGMLTTPFAPQLPCGTLESPLVYPYPTYWKRLKGKDPEGKNFRKPLRRKQSSAKISKISRNALKSSKSDIFYLLKNLLKYLLRTFFLPRSFQKFLPFASLPSGSVRT